MLNLLKDKVTTPDYILNPKTNQWAKIFIIDKNLESGNFSGIMLDGTVTYAVTGKHSLEKIKFDAYKFANNDASAYVPGSKYTFTFFLNEDSVESKGVLNGNLESTSEKGTWCSIQIN